MFDFLNLKIPYESPLSRHNSEPLKKDSFLPTYSYVFCASSRIEHKNLLKTKHQCTFVYIMHFTFNVRVSKSLND